MNRYLLDTNHLSAYLDKHAVLEPRIDSAMRAGDRFGIALPVLCEYQAGIAIGRRFQQNMGRLRAAREVLRLWPADSDAASEFAVLFKELRQAGRALSPFDLLIAAIARQQQLTFLTADSDFNGLARVRVENWLK